MKIFFCSVFCLIFLFGCIKNNDRNGYLFDLSDHHLLQEGVTSKEKVLKIMGSPTLITNFDDEAWIYYSEEVERVLFFMPKTTQRTIMVLKFDKDQIINSLEKFDLSNEDQNLKFASKYTEVKSNKIGFFKSLYSNVGQVKAAQ